MSDINDSDYWFVSPDIHQCYITNNLVNSHYYIKYIMPFTKVTAITGATGGVCSYQNYSYQNARYYTDTSG